MRTLVKKTSNCVPLGGVAQAFILTLAVLAVACLLFGYSVFSTTHWSPVRHDGFVAVSDPVVIHLPETDPNRFSEIDVYRISPTGARARMRVGVVDDQPAFIAESVLFRALVIQGPEALFDDDFVVVATIGSRRYRLTRDRFAIQRVDQSLDPDVARLVPLSAALSTRSSLLPGMSQFVNYRGDRVLVPFLLASSALVIGAGLLWRFRTRLSIRFPVSAVSVGGLVVVLVRLYAPAVVSATWAFDTVFALLVFAITVIPASNAVDQNTSSWNRQDVAWIAALVFFLVATQLPNLAATYMWSDEAYSFYPAVQIALTGEPVYPETGFRYDRAPIYHHLLAFSMRLFGFNEFGGRIINLPINALVAVCLYLWLRRISRFAGFSAAFLFLLNPFTLEQARMVRMYPLFGLLFLLTAVSFFHTVVEPHQPVGIRILPHVPLRLDLRWAVAFVAFGYLSYNTQALIITFPVSMVLFLLWWALQDRAQTDRWFWFALFITLLFAGSWIRFRTLNLHEALFLRGTADWAQENPVELSKYFSFAIGTSPYVLLLAGSVGLFLSGVRNTRLQFAMAIIIGGFAFLAPQQQRTYRYLYAVSVFFPAATVCMVETVRTRFPRVVNRFGWLCGACAAVLILLQVHGFSVEHGRAGKNDWNRVIDHVISQPRDEIFLVASGGAIERLHAQGIDPDLFLMDSDLLVQRHASLGHHVRIGTPAIKETDLLNLDTSHRKLLVVSLQPLDRRTAGERSLVAHPFFRGPFVYVSH